MSKLFDYSIKELKVMLDKALTIDNSSDYALDEELKDHSKRHADWAFLSAKAKKLYNLKEMEFKKITAEVAAKIKQKAKDIGKPLPKTAPVAKEMVPLEEEWQDAYRELIELGEYVDILSIVEKAFNNRAWLLIRLARGREGSIEPSVKGKSRGRSKPIEMEEYEL